jgi:hypothetical protein
MKTIQVRALGGMLLQQPGPDLTHLISTLDATKLVAWIRENHQTQQGHPPLQPGQAWTAAHRLPDFWLRVAFHTPEFLVRSLADGARCAATIHMIPGAVALVGDAVRGPPALVPRSTPSSFSSSSSSSASSALRTSLLGIGAGVMHLGGSKLHPVSIDDDDDRSSVSAASAGGGFVAARARTLPSFGGRK